VGGDHRNTIRVVIHSEHGVTHGDCARVARAVGDALDDAGAERGGYDLEVSSPGLRRVLKAPFEFDVFRGLPVRVWVTDGEVRSEISGVALGTRDGDRVVLRAEDGSESVIAWSRVTKARLDEKDDLARTPGGKGR
jgi:ribosome maturation factor RimP